jgi:nucleotide-binding universal stress UspA family protein
MLELEELLVPVDLSPTSHATFAKALAMVGGERPVVVLQYVIDASLARSIAAQGYEAEDAVAARMRSRAEAALSAMAASAPDNVEVQVLVSEGTPFYEILRVAEELAVDAVVIGKQGIREHPESAFFGATAERVVRGCSRPVIVLPEEA